MATFTDTVRFVVEAVTGSAERNLKGVREELAKTEGVGGKARAALGGIGDNIRANLVPGLLGAAGAIGAFGLAAAKQFADTAREAGRLADTTGLATDEASRWLAVLKPLNVEGADLADILGNINTKASEGRLAELGIQAEDSHERLQKTIEYLGGITDETERAARASELLGEEGTRQLAPLIANADKLAASLAKVSDSQVITDSERAKAAELDETMRELNNKFRDLQLDIGPGVITILTNVSDSIDAITGAIGRLPSPPDWFEKLITKGALQLIGELGDLLPGGAQSEIVQSFTEPQSNATRYEAPPTSTTVNNYYPPSTDGRETDAALQAYWRKNGRG